MRWPGRKPHEPVTVDAPPDSATGSAPAADGPPRCPPNWHWDESIRGCVPDGGGPEVGVREPLRPSRPGPGLTAEAEVDPHE